MKRLMPTAKHFIYMATGVAVAIIITVLYVTKPPLFIWADNKIYDTFLHISPKSPVSDIPLIIDIDEKSLTEYGQWPWPRYLLAVIIQRLTDAGVASIGVDVLLSEDDRTSPKRIQDNIKRDFGLDISFNGLPTEMMDNDNLFASILAQSPIVLGMYLNFSDLGTTINKTAEPMNLAEINDDDTVDFRDKIINATGGSFPLEVFSDKATTGIINATTDIDGIVRRVPLMIALNNKGEKSVYGSLGVMTLARAYDASTIVLKTGTDGVEALRFGGLTVPVEGDGTFTLLFQGKGKSYKYISASDIISNNFNIEDITGRIVFIGSSAPGLLDIRATPLDEYFPGVEVHAAVVDSIMSGRFMSTPVWTPGLQVLLIILTSLLSAYMTGRVPPYYSIPFVFILIVGALVTSYQLFLNSFFISPLYVVTAIVFSGVIVVGYRFLSEVYERQFLKNIFGRYVAPEVVDMIADKGVEVLAGEEKEVSIIFTDIRSFTSMSEKLKPQQVVGLLNRYFTPMTAIIRQRKGTLDKFIGDAIMAFWNAPIDVDDHPFMAVSSAIEMQNKLTEINSSLKDDFGVELRIGCGIHTGHVYVGNMGSVELLSYTIIGDNVNLASRLEGLCSKYGVKIVVSKDTVLKCGDRFFFQFIDKIRVKGRSAPIEVFYPITLDESHTRKDELELYEKSVTYYNKGQFTEGKESFQKLVEFFPQSNTLKLYEVYCERCAILLVTPQEGWDGVWTQESK